MFQGVLALPSALLVWAFIWKLCFNFEYIVTLKKVFVRSLHFSFFVGRFAVWQIQTFVQQHFVQLRKNDGKLKNLKSLPGFERAFVWF